MNRNRAALIGRGAELARLTNALTNALDGRPALVFMGGEAGVGKTRLLRELSQAAQQAGGRVVAGACVDLGAGDLPYAPLVDALRGLVRDIGLDRLRQLAGSGFPSLTRLAPFLGDASGVDAPEQHARSRLFEAVLQLLGQLSAETPVLLIIEDLHWADQSTLDFLSFLLKALTRERLLIVASYRSNELHPRHPLRPIVVEIDRARRAERFELRPFDLDELRQFLAAMTGEEPRAVRVRELFELSDGNPFFVEELVTGGALDGVGVDDAPNRRRVPQALREVLLARVEMMSDEAQEVLRAAATAGRRVSHRLIATVCELPERALLTALRECVVQHLLAVSLGEDAYAFRHAIAREAVYEDLLPGERIRLHTAIATALSADASLAGSQSNSVAIELAHHWQAAGNRARALAESVTAGRDAAAVWAFVESESQYARALALWNQTDGPERLTGMSRLELLNRAADAARWSGHVDRAIDWTREALAATDGRMLAERASAYERLGRYLSDAGNSDAALEAYAEADELLAGAPPSALAAGVRAARAGAHVQAGQYSLGLRLSNEAVEMARAVGAAAEEGRALNTRGVALTMTGRPDEGVPALQAAVEIAHECADLEELLRAYANLTFVLENAGRLSEALQAARRGLEESTRLGVQSEASGALLTVSAILLLELGQWAEAETIANDVLSRDTPARVALYFQLWLAEIDVYRGRLDEARERLATSRETLQVLKEPVSTGTWYGCRAELAIWQRDHATVRETIAEGLAAVGDAEDAPQVLRLCSYGLRAEADEGQRLSAMGLTGSPAADAVRAIGADLARRAEQAARPVEEQPVLPEVSVLAQQCRAEWSRLDGQADADAWAQVASGWQRLERQYPSAYAAWRHAETLLDGPDRDPRRAASILREAHRVAVDLGAEPLRQEIVALARRARLDLSEPAADKPAGVSRPGGAADQPGDPFGLTPRERQVLTYLGHGHTNRRIARELFISEKTAGVHVSNILAKLQVTNRSEAAAVAYRLGLIEPE